MEIPRHWRLKKQRYGLVGVVCMRCEHPIFPPRGVCPNCAQSQNQKLEASQKAEGYLMVYDSGAQRLEIEASLPA